MKKKQMWFKWLLDYKNWEVLNIWGINQTTPLQWWIQSPLNYNTKSSITPFTKKPEVGISSRPNFPSPMIENLRIGSKPWIRVLGKI